MNSGGTVSPGVDGPGILTVDGNVRFRQGSAFLVKLLGTTAGSGYDQLRVNGRANLGRANLVLSLGFVSTTGNSFTIIQQTDPDDPLQGRFEGLRQMETFQVGNRRMRINYHGGDENDVVLTDVGPAGSEGLLAALLG